MTYSNNPNKHSETLAKTSAKTSTEFPKEDFDRLLRQVDDFYGEAPGLTIPPHFVARVIAKAKAESVVARERKSVWNWFAAFSMPVRVAAVSALLLASWGGVRAGLVITDLMDSGKKAEPVAHIEIAPAEQSLVQLVRGEAAAVAGTASQKSGEPQ